jgi:hypothetical protein
MTSRQASWGVRISLSPSWAMRVPRSGMTSPPRKARVKAKWPVAAVMVLVTSAKRVRAGAGGGAARRPVSREQVLDGAAGGGDGGGGPVLAGLDEDGGGVAGWGGEVGWSIRRGPLAWPRSATMRAGSPMRSASARPRSVVPQRVRGSPSQEHGVQVEQDVGAFEHGAERAGAEEFGGVAGAVEDGGVPEAVEVLVDEAAEGGVGFRRSGRRRRGWRRRW